MMSFSFVCISPCYKLRGWLGVKNQISIYLFICLSSFVYLSHSNAWSTSFAPVEIPVDEQILWENRQVSDAFPRFVKMYLYMSCCLSWGQPQHRFCLAGRLNTSRDFKITSMMGFFLPFFFSSKILKVIIKIIIIIIIIIIMEMYTAPCLLRKDNNTRRVQKQA